MLLGLKYYGKERNTLQAKTPKEVFTSWQYLLAVLIENSLPQIADAAARLQNLNKQKNPIKHKQYTFQLHKPVPGASQS